jgi:integrase
MRGDGCVFQKPGTRNWWIAYSFRGHPYQESSESTNKKVAQKLLKKRLEEVKKPHFVDPAKEQRLILGDMLEVIRLEYERKQNRTFNSVQFAFKHLQEEFEFHRVIDITSDKISVYADKRWKEDEAARASVNIELTHLRHGFKLMFEKDMISKVPLIKTLENNNARKGFIDVGDFNALLEKIEDTDVRDIVEFLYHCGWRSGEAKAFQWSWIDGEMIRLPAEFSKNKKERSLPIIGTLMDVIQRRQKLRRLDCEYVFHRNGKPIRSFRKAFKAAAKQVGYPDLLPHDMRRSAVRNFRRSGLSEGDGMELSGHKTRSIYERYNIRDDRDLTESMTRVQDHLKKEAENRKVIPLKRETA